MEIWGNNCSHPCIERYQMASAECDVARRAFAKMHSTLGRIPLGHRLFRLLATNPGSPLPRLDPDRAVARELVDSSDLIAV
jgi:hypothetical protein